MCSDSANDKYCTYVCMYNLQEIKFLNINYREHLKKNNLILLIFY